MGYVRGLRCRACGAEFPAVQIAVCESCFGPLEVTYELSAVRDSFRRADLAERPRDLWRYRELLPVLDESARVDLAVGCTPLRRAADVRGHRGPDRGNVRRREPDRPVDRGPTRLGIREHQRAAILRRRIEDLALRDVGATRLRTARCHRGPVGFGPSPDIAREGVSGTPGARRSGRSSATRRNSGRGMRTDCPRLRIAGRPTETREET